jgi:esterase/lipase superfamily enzyme
MPLIGHPPLPNRNTIGVRFALFLAAALVLGGCTSVGTRDLVETSAVNIPADAVSGAHSIFVATTRAAAKRPSQVFDGDRSDTLSFAEVDVTVPAAHEVGKLERPRAGAKVNPAKHFAATNVALFRSDSAFRDALAADIARNGGRAMVFIHGYNTGFDKAVYRATQVAHDARYPGTPVLFTWASAGTVVDYVYDNNSATMARNQLLDTLRLVASAGAKRIDIIAHSMGNWVTMEALRQAAAAGDRNFGGRLGDVVLASPDIDIDVFKSQLRDYGPPDRPFIVVTSAKDRALNISGFIAGRRRAGDYADAKDMASYGVIVADLTDVEAGDGLNHTTFADNPVMVRMLGARLTDADGLGENEKQLTDSITRLAAGVGQTMTSAAAVVITTPAAVLNVAVGE